MEQAACFRCILTLYQVNNIPENMLHTTCLLPSTHAQQHLGNEGPGSQTENERESKKLMRVRMQSRTAFS